ncbi:MAG: hypothetical protein U1E26_03205 [Coriobacteriia bacterium]|nr:hypothetical protein [Coriobacteriia bacterium]
MAHVQTDTRRADALQLIFSLFLGILLVVVVGVGVWTFYPQPLGENSPEQEELEELYKEQEQINMRSGGKEASLADQAQMKRVQDDIDAINDKMSDERDDWAVTTSIILIIFATVLMAISLFLPEHLRVFSNGFLLGGMFTLIYGTGWSFAGGDTRARFWVVLVALFLSVGIGYLRFIRGRQDKTEAAASGLAASGEAAATDAGALSELSVRVAELERRSAAAAAALSGPEERDA